MPNPVTWPGAKSFLSLGVETVQGTAVTPAWARMTSPRRASS